MFERLGEVVRAQAERLTLAELALIEAMLDAIPGVSAVRDGDRVVVAGRGLARRRIEDVRLRGGWR